MGHPVHQKTSLQQDSKAVYLEKKVFKCDRCDKTFTQKGQLLRHVNRIHKTLKNYTFVGKNNKAHLALIREAQKDEMIVSILKIVVCE
jgi:uncharacterized C2H2 Zn-finger protein